MPAVSEEEKEQSKALERVQQQFVDGVALMAAEYPSCSQALITKVLLLGKEMSSGLQSQQPTSVIPKSYAKLYESLSEKGMPSLQLYLVCQGVKNVSGKLTTKFARKRISEQFETSFQRCSATTLE